MISYSFKQFSIGLYFLKKKKTLNFILVLAMHLKNMTQNLEQDLNNNSVSQPQRQMFPALLRRFLLPVLFLLFVTAPPG